MRVYVKTYGCQMNERDSEGVSALLASRGFALAAGEDDADVIVVNTCSVREKAEGKALGKLHFLVSLKRERPGLLVGAIGCMVQRLGPAILERVRGLDFAAGTQRLAALPGLIEQAAAGGGPAVDVGAGSGLDGGGLGHLEGAVSAFVNILYGCNRRCSYCIVPAVRGPERSRPAAEVVREVESLARAGVREVTLLGQSVMSYGRLDDVWGANAPPSRYAEPLPRLLEAVSRVPGIRRVRFTSGHPSGCTEELARAMAELPGVCAHLHLPLQSASDRILGLMRRGYTADGYRAAAARLRAAMPRFALTTDIIVGFPSETAEDFERTRLFMDEMEFDNAFIFKYSPRSGTPAAAWTDDVTPEEKRRRNHVLLVDQDRRGLAIHERLIGSDEEVLVEGLSLRNPARWSGRTSTNKIVAFENTVGAARGDLLAVRVEQVFPQTLVGRPSGERAGEPVAASAGAPGEGRFA